MSKCLYPIPFFNHARESILFFTEEKVHACLIYIFKKKRKDQLLVERKMIQINQDKKNLEIYVNIIKLSIEILYVVRYSLYIENLPYAFFILIDTNVTKQPI